MRDKDENWEVTLPQAAVRRVASFSFADYARAAGASILLALDRSGISLL
jgi:hypothetical protein